MVLIFENQHHLVLILKNQYYYNVDFKKSAPQTNSIFGLLVGSIFLKLSVPFSKKQSMVYILRISEL